MDLKMNFMHKDMTWNNIHDRNIGQCKSYVVVADRCVLSGTRSPTAQQRFGRTGVGQISPTRSPSEDKGYVRTELLRHLTLAAIAEQRCFEVSSSSMCFEEQNQ
jgi:hypothetical protein